MKLAAAGDLCDAVSVPGCRFTSDAILSRSSEYSKVLALGDLQYPDGNYNRFLAHYRPNWGRLDSKIAPVPGNHEGDMQGYFDYFNGVGISTGVAGTRGRGWYSLTVGGPGADAWHLLALNSECVGQPCETDQLAWLRGDLADNSTKCTLAFWHKPRFSSGMHGDNPGMQPLWDLLASYDAEVVLSGHDHNYERQKPRNAAGLHDDAQGIRQFVVGTGGTGLRSVGSGPFTQASNADTHGYLEMTLQPGGYEWRFVPAGGPGNGDFVDTGSASCH